jgi:hypothetical protein
MSLQDKDTFNQVFLALTLAAVATIFYKPSVFNSDLVSFSTDIESYAVYLWCIPVSYLDFCGSFNVCLEYKKDLMMNKKQKTSLEAVLSCLLWQFGGTTMTGMILLGQPPSYIVSHTALNGFFFAYWLVFFCPFDFVYKFCVPSSSNILQQSVMFMIKLSSAISAGHAVTSWGVDKALHNTFHTNPSRMADSIYLAIFCGMFSGCGGGLIKDFFDLLSVSESYTFHHHPILFSLPVARGSKLGQRSRDIREKYAAQATLGKAFLLSSLYYVLRDPSSYVSTALNTWPLAMNDVIKITFWGHNEARCIIVALQVLSFLYNTFSPSIVTELKVEVQDDFFMMTMRGLSSLFNIKASVGVDLEVDGDTKPIKAD